MLETYFQEGKVFSNEEEQWKYHDYGTSDNKEMAHGRGVGYGLVPSLGIKKIYFNTHRDDGRYFKVVESQLKKDNVNFFKRRWHNKKDLEFILEMIKEKYPENIACRSFILKELGLKELGLEIKSQTIGLFKNYDTFGLRNHRARAKKVIRALEKARDEKELEHGSLITNFLYLQRKQHLKSNQINLPLPWREPCSQNDGVIKKV